MPAKSYTNEEIVRYLFAEMPEAECEALDDAIFEDADLFAAIAAVENDLIDDYVRGLLPLIERERFERSYLTHPTRLQRVQNARTLLAKFDQVATARMTSQREVEKTSWWQNLLASLRGQRLSFALPALALLLIVWGGWWTWSEIRQLRNQVAELQAAQLLAEQRIREMIRQDNAPRPPDDQATPADLKPAPSSTSTQTSSTIAMLRLTGDKIRSDSSGGRPEPPLLTITPNIQQVRLILKDTATAYRRYQAELQNAAGATVLLIPKVSHQKNRTASTFTVTVPADQLSTGDYFLVIKGVTSTGELDGLGNAPFRVEKP